MTTEKRTISIAHSPDSDDAFMFYGLATNKLDTGNLKFTHVLQDIQTLNEKASEVFTTLPRSAFMRMLIFPINTRSFHMGHQLVITTDRSWWLANLVRLTIFPN